jgi:hypothetical protein
MLYGPAIDEEVRYRMSVATQLAAEAALNREVRKIGASPARSAAGEAVLVRGVRAAAGAWWIVKAMLHAARAALARASLARTTA